MTTFLTKFKLISTVSKEYVFEIQPSDTVSKKHNLNSFNIKNSNLIFFKIHIDLLLPYNCCQ